MNLIPQLRLLPEAVATALPLSHHRLLMHVRDEGVRRQLAEEAAEHAMTRRELEERIRETLPTPAGAQRGRKPLPGFVRTFNIVRRAAADVEQIVEVREEELAAYGRSEAIQYLEDLSATISTLEQVRTTLYEKVQSLG